MRIALLWVLCLSGCARDGELLITLTVPAAVLADHADQAPLAVTTFVDGEVLQTSVLCAGITSEVVVEHRMRDVRGCPAPEAVEARLEAATLADPDACAEDASVLSTTPLDPPATARWTWDGEQGCEADNEAPRFVIDLAL